MKLDALGHAGWLVHAGALRILCDPILFERHAGGVFQVDPPRRIRAADLRPDLILVSHAHFDHFDVESLAALCGEDADSVLVTPDELVARAASELGFRQVKQVAPGTRVDLDGDVSLTLTPSAAPDVEVGVMIGDASGLVWNMIDTVFASPADVTRVARTAAQGRPLDLALAPLQPMREIALATAGYVGFERHEYAHLLSCAAATEAGAVAPSACGEVFAEPFHAMGHWVYPVSRARALRHLGRLSPAQRGVTAALGESLVVEGGEVSVAPSALLFERMGSGSSRAFRPLEPHALVDPNLDGRTEGGMWARIREWCERDLRSGIARELGGVAGLEDLSLVLEVVFHDQRRSLTFDASGGMRDGGDDEYDVLVMVAASMLDDVIAGHRAWVEPLLAGLLRSSVRGVHVRAGEASVLPVAPIFPYYGLPYRESVERAVAHRVRRTAG